MKEGCCLQNLYILHQEEEHQEGKISTKKNKKQGNLLLFE